MHFTIFSKVHGCSDISHVISLVSLSRSLVSHMCEALLIGEYYVCVAAIDWSGVLRFTANYVFYRISLLRLVLIDDVCYCHYRMCSTG